MDFEEERKVILRCVQEGRLEVEEAARLLRALDRAEAAETGRAGARDGDGAGSDVGASASSGAETSSAGGDAKARSGGDDSKTRLPTREEVEQWLDRLSERLQGLGEKLEGARERVEEAISSARSRVGHEAGETREELDKAWESLQRTIGNVISEVTQRFGSGSGTFVHVDWDPLRGRPMHRVEKPLSLPELPAGGQAEIRCRNGSVRIEGTDGPPSLLLRMRVRGDDEERARARAEELVSLEQHEDGWRLITHEERGESVDIRLALPRGEGMALKAVTSNGRLSLRNMTLRDLQLETENGSMEAVQVRSHQARLETHNGELRVDGFTGTALQCRSANGSLRVRARVREAYLKALNGSVELEPALAAGEATVSPGEPGVRPESPLGEPDGEGGERRYLVETVNGRVRVAVPLSDRVGYRFDLETVQGRITMALDDLKHILHESPARGGLRAETFDFGARPERVDLQVRSRNGSIHVEAGSL